MSYVLETLTPPGLTQIKQVELYKKFWPYMPPRHWDENCPRPSNVVLDLVKQDAAGATPIKTAFTEEAGGKGDLCSEEGDNSCSKKKRDKFKYNGMMPYTWRTVCPHNQTTF
jgi:hypothetical protein